MFLISKEVVVNIGLVPFIDMYTDPDAINQLIIKMVKDKKKKMNIYVFFFFFKYLVPANTINN